LVERIIMRILAIFALSLALTLSASAQISSINSLVPIVPSDTGIDKNDTRIPVVVVEMTSLELKQIEKAESEVVNAKKVLKENEDHLAAIQGRILDKYSPNPNPKSSGGVWTYSYCGSFIYSAGTIDRQWVVYNLILQQCSFINTGNYYTAPVLGGIQAVTK
jgi:hypothetical protein